MIAQEELILCPLDFMPFIFRLTLIFLIELTCLPAFGSTELSHINNGTYDPPHQPVGRFSGRSEQWWCHWRVGRAAPTSGIPWKGSSTRNPPVQQVTQSRPELEKRKRRKKNFQGHEKESTPIIVFSSIKIKNCRFNHPARPNWSDELWSSWLPRSTRWQVRGVLMPSPISVNPSIRSRSTLSTHKHTHPPLTPYRQLVTAQLVHPKLPGLKKQWSRWRDRLRQSDCQGREVELRAFCAATHTRHSSQLRSAARAEEEGNGVPPSADRSRKHTLMLYNRKGARIWRFDFPDSQECFPAPVIGAQSKRTC